MTKKPPQRKPGPRPAPDHDKEVAASAVLTSIGKRCEMLRWQLAVALTEREQAIRDAVVDVDMTYQAIADCLNIERSRVQQIYAEKPRTAEERLKRINAS